MTLCQTLVLLGLDGDFDGFTGAQGDCAECDAAVYPGATEVCNTVDDDCDTQVDEGLTTTVYLDGDTDTYGWAGTSLNACTTPVAGYVSNSSDCNDGNAAIKPGATEVCDAVDNDCDTLTDENVQNVYFPDADEDGYGDAASDVGACSAPSGYVEDNSDCDDTDPAINPGAGETICDFLDDNCNNIVDEGLVSIFWEDADDDGYGNIDMPFPVCDTPPEGYVENENDCDDTDPLRYNNAFDGCDEIDNDCDDEFDEDDECEP